MAENLEQLLLATVNNKEFLHSEPFEYKSLFLSSVTPDVSNARFMPCIFIEDEHAKQFISRAISKRKLCDLYNGENYVLVGKSCIVNCLKYGSSEWKKANTTIESIVELGENIAVSEMIQVPTVYPIDDGKYQILTGHRRFFALVFAYGFGHVAQFKVYARKPILSKVKQFQENASREDLPQYGKLQAFLAAMMEVDYLEQARLKIGEKRITVREKAKYLGISLGAFDNYNVLTRYPEVIRAYENGLSFSFVKVKKIVLKIENDYKLKNDKKVLNIGDRKAIGARILDALEGKASADIKKQSYSIKNISSISLLKKLLFNDISELDLGIDWENINWEDRAQVTTLIAEVIELLDNN